MPPRYDDEERQLTLSVRDLIASGPRSGHLVVDVVQSATAAMNRGRRVHQAWQAEQAARDPAYRAEVSLAQVLLVDGWEVRLTGRVDGLTTESGRPLVEEIKATALPEARLRHLRLADVPAYTAQLEVYLWMLGQDGHDRPLGRLVLVGLLDGARQLLPLEPDHEAIGAFVLGRLSDLLAARARRNARMALRRTWAVPSPFPTWRDGQQHLSDRVRDALGAGQRLLAQAPTGLGKTAAVLHGALQHALSHDQQLFWATSRHTQQDGVLATLDRFREAGLPLTRVALRSREALCLQEVVACRPDVCPHAADYYDKLRALDLVDRALAEGGLTPDRARELGSTHQVCPFELSLDTLDAADVIVGDVNHALAPGARIARLFRDRPDEQVVLVDEAHQLPERARGWRSPAVHAHEVSAALQSTADEALAPFHDLALGVRDALLDEPLRAKPPYDQGVGSARPDVDRWSDLADRFDDLGLDYALLRAEQGRLGEGPDPWVRLGHAVQRLSSTLRDAAEDTTALVHLTAGEESLRLVCLDPAPTLQPVLAELGGFVALSATLSPFTVYADLLGLPADAPTVDLPSPFPPERRLLLTAAHPSTLYRDRAEHLPRIATLIRSLTDATPGNLIVYTSSFAVLDTLAELLRAGGLARPLHTQPRQQSHAERRTWLDLLRGPEPVVLGAVLGGVYAEGIDPPPGALDTLVIVGPALPPVGRERDLLRAYHEDRGRDGFVYASLVPGLTKVVQAAGRLVRRPEDRGVVVLVGKRFRWRQVRALLPATWEHVLADDPAAAARAFFEGSPAPSPSPAPTDAHGS